jgi:hypothetical protein
VIASNLASVLPNLQSVRGRCQERGDGLQLQEDTRVDQFVGDGMFENVPNAVHALVAGHSNPTEFYKPLANGLESQGAEIFGRSHAVQVIQSSNDGFHAIELAGQFTILAVVAFSMPQKHEAEFTYAGTGVGFRIISWKSSTIGFRKRINLDATSMLCDQLPVANSGFLRTIVAEQNILSVNSDSCLSGLLVPQIRRENVGFSCHVRDSISFRGRTSTIEAGFSPH